MSRIKIAVFFLSLASALLSVGKDFSQPFSYLFLLPLSYGVLYYIFIPNTIHYFGVGFFILNISLFIRYVIYIPLFCFNNYKSSFITFFPDSYIIPALFIMLYEMLTIFIVIRLFLFYKNKKFNVQPPPPIRAKVPFALLIIVLFAIYFNKSILANYNFVFISEGFAFNKERGIGSGVEIQLLKWSTVFIVLFLFALFKNKFDQTSKSKYLIYSLIPPFISLLFFFGRSRFSLLLPLLSYWFVFVKYYKKFSFKITFYLLGYGFVALSIISAYKFFGVVSINEGAKKVNVEVASNYLNSYFGGIANVIIGLKATETYEQEINIATLKNDVFGNAMGISNLTNRQNRTTYYFNKEIYGKRDIFIQIVPTIIQGKMYFGYLFSVLATIIMVFSMMLFDYHANSSVFIENTYLYAFMGATLGFAVIGNITHLFSSLFNLVIPLTIFFYLNRLIFVLKLKNREPDIIQ